MKPLLIIALLVLSYATPAKKLDNVPNLIQRETVLNEQCRGGSGDDLETQKACDKRDKLNKQLNALSWCWMGKNEATSSWKKCKK